MPDDIVSRSNPSTLARMWKLTAQIRLEKACFEERLDETRQLMRRIPEESRLQEMRASALSQALRDLELAKK